MSDLDITLPVLPAVAAPPRAASRRAALAATAAVRDAMRALAAAAYARRLMRAEFDTRDQAVAARVTLDALIAPLLDEGVLDGAAFAALSTLWGLASGHLIDRMTSLKPIVRVSTGKPLPATLLAWQLYGDTERAGELVRRNGVATPSFMPTILEAVAP
jgi:prophage DNA circulation protein